MEEMGVNFPALKGEACSSSATGLVQATQRRTSGVHYGHPEERDILGSVVVGITTPAAVRVDADKPFPHPLTEMEATVTHTRGIGRIDQDQGDASIHALVLIVRANLERVRLLVPTIADGL